MQFIDGQSLAAVIRELRQLAGLETRDEPGSMHPAAGLAGELASGRWAPVKRSGADPQPTTACVPASKPSPTSLAETATLPVAALSTERSTKSPAFFRTVASLGVQAAEALEHAHQLGIVHRDVKPANLLVDTKGNLWITDFGLARLQNETSLTVSGDVVGTLRYMSPEQALGHPAAVDHRTDVYSLGATLYELVSLCPAQGGRDRQELLRQIASAEPRRPRRLNPAVPAELEIIIQKALEKEAEARYATARELADDLERFLKDEPIRARRPTLVRRARKWARRHRPVVWSAAVALLVALAVLAGSVGWVVRDRATRQAKTAAAVEAALEEARRFQREGKWPEGQAAAKRAEALLASGGGSEELQQRVHELLADFRMVAKLEEVRLLGSGVKDGHFDYEAEDRGYAAAFRDYGIDIEALDPREAAECIGARAIRVELAAALDDWARKRRWVPQKDGKSWPDLLAVARDADPDPWRTLFRDAVLRGDRQALAERADDEIRALPPVTLVLLAAYLAER
jgi:hypothetical protein